MASWPRLGRGGPAAALIAAGVLATAGPAGALTVDPQKLADSLGLPRVAGAPALPSITIPDPPLQVQAPAPQPGSSVPSASTPRPATGTAASPAPRASTATEHGARVASTDPSAVSSGPGSTRGTGAPLRAANPPRLTAPAAAATGAVSHPITNVGAHSAGNPLDVFGGSLPLPDWSKPIILALLLIALVLALRSWVMARRARRLEAQRAALVRDVDAMQVALAPEVPTRQGPLEVSAAYRPAEGPAAGGDFYDVFALDATRVGVMVGDVSGHGRAALARAAQTRFTLRAYLELGMQPRAVLALAGRQRWAGAEEFATVAVGVYEAASGALTYATAGHPPPIVLGAGDFEPITDCASVPLGWGVPTGRRQTTVSLPTGAIACFYSDGLPEARAGGELLGRHHVVEILAELGPSPQAAMLLERVRGAADDAPDDMAACLIRTTSAATDSVRLEEIELDDRQLRAGRGERFLRACDVATATVGPALKRARETVGAFGAVIMRVNVGRRAGGVVVEPSAHHGTATPAIPNPADHTTTSAHVERRAPANAG